MSSPIASLFSNLPGADDIRQWEEECARIDTAIDDLRTKRDQFGQMIDLARALLRAAPPKVEVPETRVEPRAAPVERLKKGGSRRREQTWNSAVEVIVKAHEEGVSYAKIKELVPARLKEQLVQYPAAKGFYTALRKLEEDGVLVRQNSMAFTKKAYALYLRRVEAGEIEAPSRRRGSPIEEAIKEFLRENGPTKGTALRAHLIQFDDFAGPVIRNSSAMYNVLLRLKEHGEIFHNEEAATYSLVEEIGAPTAMPLAPQKPERLQPLQSSTNQPCG